MSTSATSLCWVAVWGWDLGFGVWGFGQCVYLCVLVGSGGVCTQELKYQGPSISLVRYKSEGGKSFQPSPRLHVTDAVQV